MIFKVLSGIFLGYLQQKSLQKCSFFYLIVCKRMCWQESEVGFNYIFQSRAQIGV